MSISKSFVFYILFLVQVSFLCLQASSAQALPWNLNPDFGSQGNGLELTPIGSGDIFDFPKQILEDTQGRFLVVGTSSVNQKDFAVARYHSNGTLDSSFGLTNSGITLIDLGGEDNAHTVVIDSLQRIFLIGYSNVESDISQNHVAVVRLSPDGIPDTSFDEDGKKFFHISDNHEVKGYVATIYKTSIWIGGSYRNDQAKSNFMVLKINTNGEVINSFGNQGWVTTNFTFSGSKTSDDEVKDIVYHRNSQTISLAGSTFFSPITGPSPTKNDFAIARYSALDGSPTTSFGNSGRLILDFWNGYDVAIGIAQKGNQLVVGGVSSDNEPSYYFTVVQLNEDGSLDENFGQQGKAFTPSHHSDVSAFSKDEKNNVILSVNRDIDEDFQNEIQFVRFDTDGILDQSFGSEGYLTLDISFNVFVDSLWASSEMLTFAGRNFKNGNADFGIGQLIPDKTDLSIIENDLEKTVTIDQPLSTTIAIENLSPHQAEDILFSLELNDKTAVIEESIPQDCTLSEDKSKLGCHFPQLEAFNSINLSFTLIFATTGNYKLPLEISNIIPETNLANNKASLIVNVTEAIVPPPIPAPTPTATPTPTASISPSPTPEATSNPIPSPEATNSPTPTESPNTQTDTDNTPPSSGGCQLSPENDLSQPWIAFALFGLLILGMSFRFRKLGAKIQD